MICCCGRGVGKPVVVPFFSFLESLGTLLLLYNGSGLRLYII